MHGTGAPLRPFRFALFSLGLLVALASPLVLSSPADAQDQLPPERAAAAVREMLLHVRYDDAIAASQAYLERTDLNASQRNLGLELLATAQLASGDEGTARQTMLRLFSRDPGYNLTDRDASPRVIGAFQSARATQPAPVQVELRHEELRELPERTSPTVEVELGESGDAVGEVHLYYRMASEVDFADVRMSRRTDGHYVAHIPLVGSAREATDVAYYVRALSPSDFVLGSRGSEAQPLQLRIPAEGGSGDGGQVAIVPPSGETGEPAEPPDEGSVAEQWWFWTIIGLVVAGGAAAGVAVALTQEGPEQGSLGSARLQLRF